MNEDVKSENLRIHSRADELIACLEGEIAKRDARIVELESRYQRDVWGLNNEGDPIGGEPAGGYANDNARLRAELAALKEQYLELAALSPSSPLTIAAPVSEAKAQGVVMPERDAVIRKVVGMCNRIPGSTTWNAAEYAYDELASRLNAAPAAPAADAGLVAVEWEKDAEEWGPALNGAGWLFLSELNEDPQKSALIFNNTKGPLRAAIMKYAEIVAANAKDSSHD